MSLQTQSWERRLLDLAHEALESHIATLHFNNDLQTLQLAYDHCFDITKEYSKTFYLSSGLLQLPKREAARALYAFCRVCDNIVDVPSAGVDPMSRLNTWRDRLLDPHTWSTDPVAMAWGDTRVRYRIPWRYAEQLIDGVAQDLTKTRYQTFDELAEYSYGVASTVGLMAMHIIGFESERAIPFAVKLGVALQITNILRDVAEDWRNGRVYLPAEELESYGLSDADLEAGVVNGRWRAFMRFQINRTRRLYDEALPGVALLDRDGRFAIRAAAELYRGILDDIEAWDYDVFSRRASVSLAGKLRRLPGIWRRSAKEAYYGNIHINAAEISTDS
jgi:phytoene synthase